MTGDPTGTSTGACFPSISWYVTGCRSDLGTASNRCCRRLLMKKKPRRAAMAITPNGTPTPMPALAPVLRPSDVELDFDVVGVVLEVGVEVEVEVEVAVDEADELLGTPIVAASARPALF